MTNLTLTERGMIVSVSKFFFRRKKDKKEVLLFTSPTSLVGQLRLVDFPSPLLIVGGAWSWSLLTCR